jgi:hypothetical protein
VSDETAGIKEPEQAYRKPDASGETKESVSKPARARPRVKGGTVQTMHGTRIERYYSLNDTDISHLSIFGLLATFFFSAGAACIGMAVDIYRDMSTAVGLPETAKSFWTGVQYPLFGAGVVFMLVGLGLTVARAGKARGIKNRTKFDDEQA